MDIEKLSLEKTFYFIAGIIPGSIAIAVYACSNPKILQTILAMPSIGYGSKLAIVLLGAFVIGNSLTAALQSILGGIGGVIGSQINGSTYPDRPEIAPWREREWRRQVTLQLGDTTPAQNFPMSPAELDLRRIQILSISGQAAKESASRELQQEQYERASADIAWEDWYRRFQNHAMEAESLKQNPFGTGLRINFQAAAVYLSVSLFFVSCVRHWWCYAFCFYWLLQLFAESYTALRTARNPWTTLSSQMSYLFTANKNREPK